MIYVTITIFSISFLQSILAEIVFLTENQLKITWALISELQIHHCIFIGNNALTISEFKQFSVSNIPIAYYNYSRFISYLEVEEYIYFNIGLIFNENSLTNLDQIAKFLAEEERSYQMQHFTCLAFVKYTDWQENQELKIPYDCEFIAIEPEVDGVIYKLSEIYEVKNKKFTLDFGAYHQEYGLTLSQQSFYNRRLDFNQTKTIVLNVYENVSKYFFCKIRLQNSIVTG